MRPSSVVLCYFPNSHSIISRREKGKEFGSVGSIRVTLGLDSRGQPHAYPKMLAA
jgi:hypothetical protein